MLPRRLRRLMTAALAGLCCLAAASPLPAAAAAAPAHRWLAAWGSSTAWGYGTGHQVTVRQVVPLTAGGTALRVRISNVFGNAPLEVGAATVGEQRSGAALVPGSLAPLSFHGGAAVTVPAGQEVLSDPLPYPTHAGEVLEVSLYVADADLDSLHPCCMSTPYSYYTSNGAGDQTAAVSGGAFPLSSQWSRWVDAVDVLGTAPGTLVAFGDSITDGFNTTVRWPDVLAHRLSSLPAAQRPAVIDEGITANTASAVQPSYAKVGGGPPGVDRLQRDVLSLPGVREMIELLGTNDLWFGASVAEVESALTQIAEAAKAAGVVPVGVTLLPRAGSERWTPAMQAELVAVNQWLLDSPTYPVVLNWAAVVADHYDGACNLTAMYPPYDSGDHLHPNAAGQTAMADAIPASLLGVTAPLAPPLVPVTPTPHCAVGPLVVYHTNEAALAPFAPPPSPTPSPSPARPTAPPSQPAATRSPRAAAGGGAGGGTAPLIAAAVVLAMAAGGLGARVWQRRR